MKKSLQIITIGSIFLLCGASFFGIVSVNNDNISTGFWNIRQLTVPTTYADDDRDDDNDNERDDDNDDRDDDNDNERDDDDNDHQYTAPSTTTPTTTTPTTTPSTSPSNSTPIQTCTTVYDTVTNASGTATQVPRQSCTTVTPPLVVTPVIPTTPVVTPVITPIIPVVTPIPTGSQFKDGTYTGVGRYSFAGGSVNYSISLTIASGRISQASFISFTASGNGKFTRAQGDAILQNIVSTNNTNIDTVTGATGTSQAVQDAVNNALSQARISPAPATITTNQPTDTTPTINTPATVVIPNTKKNIPTVSSV